MLLLIIILCMSGDEEIKINKFKKYLESKTQNQFSEKYGIEVLSGNEMCFVVLVA